MHMQGPRWRHARGSADMPVPFTMLGHMRALHIGGKLHGQELDTPDDKLMYRAEGTTYAIHLVGTERTPIWAPSLWCYKKVKANYEHHLKELATLAPQAEQDPWA